MHLKGWSASSTCFLASMLPQSLYLVFASARKVNLYFCLYVPSSRYAKLAELKNDKALKVISDQIETDIVSDDMVLYSYLAS